MKNNFVFSTVNFQFSILLQTKYQSLGDAMEILGDVQNISSLFIEFQKHLYNIMKRIANPTTPISNIEGGLGIWGGYGVYLDTIVITKDIIKH